MKLYLQVNILWMDGILHHVRNPGMIGFPCKYQQIMVSYGFQCGAKWISSIHSSDAFTK